MSEDGDGARYGLVQPDDAKRVVEAALLSHPDRTGRLIGVLEDVQEAFRFLPGEAIDLVATRLDVPREQIVTMGEFFSYLSTEPVGRVVVEVCDGTACHMQGAPQLIAELEKRLGVSAGQTSADGAVTLRVVGCVGACGRAPVVVVDGNAYGRVRVVQAADIAALALELAQEDEPLMPDGDASALMRGGGCDD